MSNFKEITAFVSVASRGSLSAAARAEGVTPAMMGRRIDALEERLGVRLIARNTRRFSLTQEGEIYLSEGQRILSEIDDLEHAISSSQGAPIGLLKVQATFGFGRSFIAPAISRFSEMYPDLEIQLFLTDRPVSLAEGKIDVSVRFGSPPDGRVMARKIANHRRRIFASPIYLRGRDRPVVPNDLIQHNCLIVRQDDVAYGQWYFTKARKTQSVKVRGSLSSNDGAAVLTWALHGHGVIMRSEWDAAPFVRSGQLEVLLEEYALAPADIYAVYPQKQNLPAKVRVFVDFLAEYFAQKSGQQRSRW